MSGSFSWDYGNPLARAKGELRSANSALWDYVQMGAGRSLRKLRDAYEALEEEHQGDTDVAPHAREHPPTTVLRTLKRWSSRYQWQDRLSRWEELEREEHAALRARADLSAEISSSRSPSSTASVSQKFA